MSQTLESTFREIIREEVREALKENLAAIGRPQSANTPKKLSLAEAGEMLGFSYPSMLQLAHREDFPAFKVMGRWVVPYVKMMDWLDHNATDGMIEL